MAALEQEYTPLEYLEKLVGAQKYTVNGLVAKSVCILLKVRSVFVWRVVLEGRGIELVEVQMPGVLGLPVVVEPALYG